MERRFVAVAIVPRPVVLLDAAPWRRPHLERSGHDESCRRRPPHRRGRWNQFTVTAKLRTITVFEVVCPW